MNVSGFSGRGRLCWAFTHGTLQVMRKHEEATGHEWVDSRSPRTKNIQQHMLTAHVISPTSCCRSMLAWILCVWEMSRQCRQVKRSFWFSFSKYLRLVKWMLWIINGSFQSNSGKCTVSFLSISAIVTQKFTIPGWILRLMFIQLSDEADQFNCQVLGFPAFASSRRTGTLWAHEKPLISVSHQRQGTFRWPLCPYLIE